MYENGGFFVASRYVVQHPERRHGNDKRRVAGAQQRQRNARGRNAAAYDERVDKRLQPVGERDARGKQKRKKIGRLRGDFNSAENDKGKDGK